MMGAFDRGNPSPWRIWRDRALQYLPPEISSDFKNNLEFFTMERNDGCRLPRAICEKKEIILFSERILPRQNSEDDDPEVRYFIYIVLHEIAHAHKKHKSPLLDGLSQEEKEAQEKEAHETALKWFNTHVRKPLTDKEIEETKEKNNQLINKLYWLRPRL